MDRPRKIGTIGWLPLTRLFPPRSFAVAALLVVAMSGVALGFHKYSFGGESSQGVGYTGTKNTHRVLGLSITTCGVPVYQPNWVIFNDNPHSWLEIGTAYTCESSCPNSGRCWYDYVYWCGDDSAGGCGFLGKWYYPSTDVHKYQIVRDDSNHNIWKTYIDGNLRTSGADGSPFRDWPSAWRSDWRATTRTR